MRKRNCTMLLRFTKSEMDALTKKARKTNLSREGYCRTVLNGAEVKTAPPAEYYDLIREVKRTGSNIDQLLKLANSKGLLDVPAIRKALEQNHAAEQMLWDTFQPS